MTELLFFGCTILLTNCKDQIEMILAKKTKKKLYVFKRSDPSDVGQLQRNKTSHFAAYSVFS